MAILSLNQTLRVPRNTYDPDYDGWPRAGSAHDARVMKVYLG